jgi:hypothetical protein
MYHVLPKGCGIGDQTHLSIMEVGRSGFRYSDSWLLGKEKRQRTLPKSWHMYGLSLGSLVSREEWRCFSISWWWWWWCRFVAVTSSACGSTSDTYRFLLVAFDSPCSIGIVSLVVEERALTCYHLLAALKLAVYWTSWDAFAKHTKSRSLSSAWACLFSSVLFLFHVDVRDENRALIRAT